MCSSDLIYNIGGNSEHTNNEIVHLIINKIGANEEQIEYVADRLGHDQRYALDHSKITAELGWRPQVSFELGIKRTVEWYLENKSWWESLKK